MAAEQWVTGIQHIGIPTSDIEKTIRFYEKLGFSTEHTNVVPSNGAKVAFLRMGNLVVETYAEGGKRAEKRHGIRQMPGFSDRSAKYG